MAFYEMKDLEKTLGGKSPLKSFEQLSINQASNFLQGKATSMFTQAMESKTAKNATLAVSNALGTLDAANSLVKNPEQLQIIAKQIIDGALNTLTSEIQGMVADTTKELMSLPLQIPSLIQKYATDKFNKDKISILDALGIKSKDPFDVSVGNVDLLNEVMQSKAIKKILDKVDEFKQKADIILRKTNETLSQINYYIAEGPDMVQKVVDESLSEALDYVDQYRQEMIKTVKTSVLGGVKKTIYKKDENGDYIYETYEEDVYSDPAPETNALGVVKTITTTVTDENGKKTIIETPVMKPAEKIHSKGDYIMEGNYIKRKIKIVDEEATNSENNIIDGMCKSVGDSIGGFLAKKYNDIVTKAAEKQRQKIANTREKLQISAAAAVQTGSLKLMGMLGVNIPISVKVKF